MRGGESPWADQGGEGLVPLLGGVGLLLRLLPDRTAGWLAQLHVGQEAQGVEFWEAATQFLMLGRGQGVAAADTMIFAAASI